MRIASKRKRFECSICRVVLFLFLFGLTQAEEKKKRTIFAAPFSNLTTNPNYDHAVVGFGDLIGVLLSTHDNIVLVERMGRDVIDAERNLKESGLVTTGDSHYVALARELKADTVLTGHLSINEEGKTVIGVKGIDIESERVVAVDSEVVEDNQIDDALQKLTNRFGKRLQITLPKIDTPDFEDRPFARLYFSKGLSRYYSGNLDAAIMNFTRALRLDPDYVEAHYFSGLCYQQLKEPDHAAVEWNALLKKRPDFQLSEEELALLKSHSR